MENNNEHLIDFGAAGDGPNPKEDNFEEISLTPIKSNSDEQNSDSLEEGKYPNESICDANVSIEQSSPLAPTTSSSSINPSNNEKLIIQVKPECGKSILSTDIKANSVSSSTSTEEEEKPCISDKWYTNQTPELTGCPFKSMHHAGLEFLQFPVGVSDKRSKKILSGMNDFSSSVFLKLQFIVNNLRDCQGIWQQLFLQKLNTMLVHADQGVIRAAFCKDNYSIFTNLVDYYIKETKCSMVFRYWCFFYNTFSKGLVQVLPVDLKNKFLGQLEKDFNLAIKGLCRCKLDMNCCCGCEPDAEHRMIDIMKQMRIIGVLMYCLICKLGNYSINVHDVFNDTARHCPNTESFVNETLVKFYISLQEKSYSACNDSVNETEQRALMMELICHLLIACQAIPHGKAIFESALQKMLDVGCLTSALEMKDALLDIFRRECGALMKGQDIKLTFTLPEIKIGFSTLGVSSVIMALNSAISSLEYDIFSRSEAISMMDMVLRIQSHLSQNGSWNSECENIYLHCRNLQTTLEGKLCGNIRDVKLDSDTESGGGGIEDMNPNAILDETTDSDDDASQTSRSCLKRSKARSSTSVIEDLGLTSYDEWCTDNENILKLRRAYAHELKDSEQKGGLGRWIRNLIFCGCAK